MTYLFVHGWGWDESIWHKMAAHQNAARHHFVNLGFCGDAHEEAASRSDSIAVGHSLGFLWLLMQPVCYRGYISINGFTHFDAALLRAMRREWNKEPQETLLAFHHACGRGDAYHHDYRWQRLEEGLDWLAAWNGAARLSQLRQDNVPVVVVAGKKDTIVKASHTQQCFATLDEKAVRWCEDGGHLLPLTHPQLCLAAMEAMEDCARHGGA